MSDERITELDTRRPHRQGPAYCIVCGFEWQAVAPVGTLFLECSRCHDSQGVFRDHVWTHEQVSNIVRERTAERNIARENLESARNDAGFEYDALLARHKALFEQIEPLYHALLASVGPEDNHDND